MAGVVDGDGALFMQLRGGQQAGSLGRSLVLDVGWAVIDADG
jgi:hypothetical protein